MPMQRCEAEGLVVSNPAALAQHAERCRRLGEQEGKLAEEEEAAGGLRARIGAVKVGGWNGWVGGWVGGW